jgi:hypothetical protein
MGHSNNEDYNRQAYTAANYAQNGFAEPALLFEKAF